MMMKEYIHEETNKLDKTDIIPKHLKISISAIALTFIILHIICPQWVDNTVIALLLILIAPWILPYVKSIPTPFGPIEQKEIINAVKNVEKLEKTYKLKDFLKERAGFPPTTFMKLEYILLEDPNLALAGLRMELEKKLRKIAIERDLIKEDRPVPLSKLIKILLEKDIITKDAYNSLISIISICNKAVHGAKIDTETALRVIDTGYTLLNYLDYIGEKT